jgi:probable rRNA maturation factor
VIEIINRQHKFPVDERKFRKLLEELIRRRRLKDPELTLAFVGDRAITTLNRKFRKKDKPTDVLSFPIGEKGTDGKYYLGDIIISVPKAFRQSRAAGHGLERELGVLIIHGFLHLLGYKHSRGVEREDERLRKALLKD